MTTTYSYLSLVQPALSAEIDVFVANRSVAVTPIGAHTRIAKIVMQDRLRLVVFTDDSSLFDGIFCQIASHVDHITDVHASDANGIIEIPQVKILESWTTADTIAAGHMIWPVVLAALTDVYSVWIRTNPDLLHNTSIHPYDSPESMLYGMTPPSGYESGIYMPFIGDRVKALTEIGGVVPADALGVVTMIYADGGAFATVDWDDYPIRPALLTDIEVVGVDEVPGVPAAGTNADPPVISDAAAAQASNSSVVISWTTDKPSTSQVFYGPTAAYGSATPLDDALVTEHSIEIAELDLAGDYHFRIESTDIDGNTVVSGDLAASLDIRWSTSGCLFMFQESETGGIPERQPINPWVILKYSDDGGFTWSNEKWRQVPRSGKTRQRVIWNRLGQSRDRIFWIEITDPIKVILVDAYIKIRPGTS